MRSASTTERSSTHDTIPDLFCVVHDPDGGVADRFGASVADIDDITGDGESEFVVGNPGYDGVASGAGSALIFNSFSCAFSQRLTDPAGAVSDDFGTAVAGAGDVDMDGTPDIAVGSPDNDGPGSNRGSVFVFSGDDFQLIHELTDPAGEDNDRVGTAIVGPGDLNDDGHADIVAASIYRDSGRGVLLVFSGLDGSLMDTWSRPGASANDFLGQSLGVLGDITGDGVAEIVAGEINADTPAANNAGQVVIFNGVTGAIENTIWDPTGASNDDFGSSVGDAGNVDGDGLHDVVVGVPLRNVNGDADVGAVQIYSSVSGSLLWDLTASGGAAGDRLGSAVAGLGDVTNDEEWEIVAGAPFAERIEAANAGRALVWSLESDCDGDGVTRFDGDCDDTDVLLARGIKETCDLQDNDCDNLIDEDGDGDGQDVCADCDDSDARIHDFADEICNGLDDDCDMEIDEGVDGDLDGYADTCDCDDGAASVNPGQSDLTCDHVDQDCNGITDDGASMPLAERVIDRGAERDSLDEMGGDLAIVGDLNSDGVPEIA